VNAEFKVSLTGTASPPSRSSTRHCPTQRRAELTYRQVRNADLHAGKGDHSKDRGEGQADKVAELDEQFFVQMSGAMYAEISGTGQAIGTILQP